MFQFTDYIDVRAFFISLFIGIMITYVLAPPKKYVIAYPTPETADKKIYQDDANQCYKYESKEIQCPSDKTKIHSAEIQHVEDEKKNPVLKTLQSVLSFDS